MASLVLTLSSCRDEAEIPDHGAAANPEKEVAGTYVGTWTKSTVGSTADPEVVNGSVVLTATNEAYIVNVKIESENDALGFTNTTNFTADNSNANVVKKSAEYVIYNTLATNGLGTSFTGSVSFGGEVALEFTKTVKSGRKSYVYSYVFSGTLE